MALNKFSRVLLIDRIPDKNFDKDEFILWLERQHKGMENDRQDWLGRQKKYLAQWDDYISYARSGPWDSSANFHLPLTMQHIRVVVSRFKQALFSVYPWWMIAPVERMDTERIKTIDTVMKWAVQSYVNYGKGFESAIEDWIWDFVGAGWGVMKRRWELKERKAIILEEKVKEKSEENEDRLAFLRDMAQEHNFQAPPEEKEEAIAKEVEKIIEVFNGPVVEPLAHEDILFPGALRDSMDLNEPPVVSHEFWIEESELNYRKETGYYNSDAVDETLKTGLIDPGGASIDLAGSDLRMKQDKYQGVKTENAEAGVKRARIAESYCRYDIDKDGIDEELVVHWCPRSRSLLRWTYLDRITKTGKRMLHKIDFIRRPRRSYALGLREMLFPINQELDSMHNLRMDYGNLANIPFFFYRATSGMKPEKIRLEPGMGYPLDDPNNDIHIPRFSNSTSWGFQEETNLTTWAEKLSGVTSMQSGMPSERVGASRTASGMMALLNESNSVQDNPLGHLKLGYADLLRGILADIQERIPDGLMVRVLGSMGIQENSPDGSPLFKQINRVDIAGKVDFIIMANSQSSNRELEKQRAMLISQSLRDPLLLQLGITNPGGIYTATRNFLEKNDVLTIDEYITRPELVRPALPLYDEIAAITQGLVPHVVLNDNHRAKIKGLMQFYQSPQFQQGIQLGVNAKDAAEAMNVTVGIHRIFDQQVRSQQQMQNTTGLQISPSLGARMSGMVGETGRALPHEAIANGQIPGQVEGGGNNGPAEFATG